MATPRAPYQVAALVKHSATVIFLHGLGDSGAGWLPVAKMLNKILPHVKWVLPNSPNRPITANFGMVMPGWFDIPSFDWKGTEDRVGLLDSASKIDRLIQGEIDAGTPPERIVLGGFSQGGAMSLLTGLTDRGNGARKLGGVVVMSGWLPIRDEFQKTVSPHLKETPVLMCHGTADPLVPHRLGQMTKDILTTSLGLPVLSDLSGAPGLCFKSYDSMEHTTCEQELQDLAQFLQRVLPS